MAVTPHEKLLDALAESSLVKAALVLDHDGDVKGKRGQARVLEPNATGEKKPTENVYLVELREHLLLVVFDEHVEFERLRKAVDMLIEHQGLEKPQPSVEAS